MPPKSSSGKSGGSTASGSGSQSPRSSSSPTIPERVGSWAMDDLALTWDNCDHIRSRLRNYEHLMKHVDHKTGLYTEQYCEKTVANLRANATVLSPLFKLMSRNERTLPSLDRLMEQVSKLFLRSKVTYTKNGDRIYQESWAIRRLCSLGKAQIHRGQWPKDPHDQTWSMNPISWILLFYVRPVRHLSIDIRGWKHIGNVDTVPSVPFCFFTCVFQHMHEQPSTQHSPAPQDPVLQSLLQDLGATEEDHRCTGKICWVGAVQDMLLIAKSSR
jgi:hypothetical protein